MSQLLIGLGLFALGASLGSFTNVFIFRKTLLASPKLPHTLSGRSRCPKCKRPLSAVELVPIFSWLMQRGRCRHCRQPISIQYPIVELILAISLTALFLPWPTASSSFALALLQFITVALLVILFVVDLKTMILPDKYIIALIVIALFTSALNGTLVSGLVGAAVGTGALALLWIITKRRGLGLGDVKLMVPLGLLLGYPHIALLLLLAFSLGGFISLILLATKQVTMKTAVPFGPYLAGVAIIFILWPNLPQAIIEQLF